MGSGLSIMAFTTTSRRRRKNANAAEEEDILHNKLPEAVVTHILSFLPTEDAVHTSILSKRWKNRWTSLTKLSFRDDRRCSYSPTPKRNPFSKKHNCILRNLSRRKQNFVSLVNKVLLVTDGLTMDRFSLFICCSYDASLVDTWFSNIFNRKVKNLRIDSYNHLSFAVLASHSLFKNFLLLEELELVTRSISVINVPMSVEESELLASSTSLNNVCISIEELKLLPNSIYVGNVPAKSIHFENLKLLKVIQINFKTDSEKSPRFINLRFPFLTKFEAINCAWFVDASYVIINAPLLQSISIQHDFHVDDRDIRSFIIFSSCLHLKELSYRGSDIPQSIFIMPPCHASAKIILYKSEYYTSFLSDFSVFYLLKQFSIAKSIKFEVSAVVLKLPEHLCVFPMLTHLEVGFLSVDILLALLRKTPVLKTLVLKGIHKFAEGLLNSFVVPDCLASLHVVKFDQVNGDDHVLFLANFFRQNGRMLERMCFIFNYLTFESLSKSEEMEEFKEKLSSFSNFNYPTVEILNVRRKIS